VKLTTSQETLEVRVEGETAVLGDRRVEFSALRAGDALESVRVDGRVFRVRVARDRDRVLVWCGGEAFDFRRAAGRRAARAGDSGGELTAPMPGRVRSVLVSKGDRVSRGDAILILEAMKMEHAIRATADGVVVRIVPAEGDLVDAGAELAVIENL
jgi:3-methylcrotonyl-CoA carboxylase alpha subunit